MAGVWMRVATWARATWLRTIPVVVLVALAAGVSSALAIGTRRTESAPDRYTAAYGGDPTAVLYQPYGPPLIDAVRTLPGVTRADAGTFIAAFPIDRDGEVVYDSNPFVGADDVFGARLVKGRFTEDSALEFTVNRSALELMRGEIGTEYQLVSFSQEQTDDNAFGKDEEFEGPRMTATLVGVTASPTDFEDSSPVITYSDAVLAENPRAGIVSTIMAVNVSGGMTADDVAEAVRRLPGGEEIYQGPSRIVSDSARDAIAVQSSALWIVTLVTLVAAALVAAQLVVRHLRSTSGDRRPLLALGYRPRQIATEAAIQGAIIGVAAAVLATGVAFAGSALFPLGAAAELDPDAGPRLDPAVLALAAVLLVAVSAGAAALGSRWTGDLERVRHRRATVADRLADAGLPFSPVHGARFALSRQRRRGVPPLVLGAGIALALTGIVGAFVVGTSITRVSHEPPRWGDNFDAVFGNVYIPASVDLVAPVVDDPEIRELTAATTGSLVIDGSDVTIFAFDSVKGGLVPVTTSGRAPAAANEVALGQRTARRLDRGVGDIVSISGFTGATVDATVVGITVTPETAGDGAAMTYAGYAALAPDATRNLLLVNWVGEETAEDVERMSEIVTTPPGNLAVPTTVVSLDRVTTAPYLLATLLILLTLATLAMNLIASVRERAHDLAVMRALGADRRQLRSLVHWHAITVALIGLAVALPLGALIGGRVFTLVADDLGLVPSPLVSPLLLGAVAAGTLLIANVVAVWPARRAARPPADALRRS